MTRSPAVGSFLPGAPPAAGRIQAERDMRILCELFGCTDGDGDGNSPECIRCGEDLYDDWIQVGWLTPLREWLREWTFLVVTRLFGRECEVCGKRYRRPRPDNPWVCSAACDEEWVPF